MKTYKVTDEPAIAPIHDSDAKLDMDVQRCIGIQLRAVHDEVVREPVPERLVKLLEEHERKTTERS